MEVVPEVSIIQAVVLCLLLSVGACASVLDDLAKSRDYQSCRESSYDRAGGNADGSQGNPIKVGETRTIFDVKCAGEISHIWFTFDPYDKDTLSNIILRMYWDDEKSPSVETPMGAFFGQGHGKFYSFDSLCVSVGNDAGLNCFWPMPFNKHAVITVENASDNPVNMFYYQFDYKKFAAPRGDSLYFHAQYRQAKPELSKDNYVALEAKGRGHYVGMFYYIRGNSEGWWGEGDDMIFIDDDTWPPSLHGTGMEDYFCHAWGMKEGQSYARYGAPLFEVFKTKIGNENTAYRWHLEDAITFKKSIRVTHEHGTNNDRNDDFSSVAFWYQTHPHAAFPALPSKFERLSFTDKKDALIREKKFAECHAMLKNFADRAVDTDAAISARLDMSEVYAAEGRKQDALAILAPYVGPIPVHDWTDKAALLVKKLRLNEISVPESDTWIVDGPDGRANFGEAGGSKCFRSDTAGKSPYLYFRVHDDKLRKSKKNLVLEVEYYSTGSGRLETHYNSALGDNIAARYHPAEILPMDGRPGWHTARIAMPEARLRGVQNAGADLRLTNPDGDLCVRKVSVSLAQ